MTNGEPKPEWSVEDARNMRALAERRHDGLVKKLRGRLDPIVSGLAASVIGPKIYANRLERVSQHMNRNSDAFDRYSPTHGDVVVSAYFKAGTNWIMHTCHQICHLGRAEFDHIQDVIPWPDAAQPRFWVHVDDPEPSQTPTGQRVIKSHLAATHIPITDAAKYVAVTRDPKDCAASAFHFFRDIIYGPTMPPPDIWLQYFTSQAPNFGRWDDFTASWYALRNKPNVLFLTFEEVKRDNQAAIAKIADFLGVELDKGQLADVSDATSFETMKKMNHKFYPARQGAMTNPDGKMIRKGSIGGASGLFSAQALTRFDRHWADGLAARDSTFPYTQKYGAQK